MRQLIHCGLAASLLLPVSAAWSAGGHHAVDDAAILKRGDCETEAWLARARGGERLVHAGVQCGLGPVELGVAAERARGGDTAWGLELKWAQEVADGFHVGASLSPAWQSRARPRYQGATINGLATWTPHDDWAFHANVGRSFAHRGDDETRYGVAAEWTARPGWTFLLERYRDEGTHLARAGVRWAAGRNWTLDISHARRLSGPAPSQWMLGLSVALGSD